MQDCNLTSESSQENSETHQKVLLDYLENNAKAKLEVLITAWTDISKQIDVVSGNANRVVLSYVTLSLGLIIYLRSILPRINKRNENNTWLLNENLKPLLTDVNTKLFIASAFTLIAIS
ncbi:MAG: hypothetical protein AAFX87_27760, partial [Bacteroidota bacterium]